MEDADQPVVLTDAKSPLLPASEILGLNTIQYLAFAKLVNWLRNGTGKLRGLTECLLDSTMDSTSNYTSEMHDLVSQLIKQIPRDIEADMGTLGLLVRHRNGRAGCAIQLPEIFVKIRPIVSPFSSKRWERLSRARDWREAMIAEIVRNPMPEDRQLAYGRVLASAVLWGGLISRPSLEAFYDLLPQWMKHSSMAHGRIAVTWMERGANYKRWFPDALTSLLMLRLQQSQPSAPSAVETKSLKNPRKKSAMELTLLGYFRSDESRLRKTQPKDIAELLDAALLNLEVHLPRTLAQYAAGNQVSHSLRPDAWRRLMRQPVDRKLGAEPVQDNPNTESAQEVAIVGNQASEDGADVISAADDPEELNTGPDWLPGLRTALKSEKGAEKKGAEKPKALASVRAFLKKPGLPVPAQIFAGFAEALLEEHVKSRKGNTLKTLRTRIIAVATRLPGQIRFEQPASLNGDTLQAAYQTVLEEAISDNQHQKLAQHLRAFHHYLVKTHYAENIDEAETFASADEDLTVDANLVVEDEYQDALAYLCEGHASGNMAPADPLLREVAGLILTFGYRAGLRRMEVLKLQLTDFIDKDPAELLVRPWEQRRLKTPNATRKMPLYALFTPDELTTLRKWKARRQEDNEKAIKKGIAPSPFLFSIPDMDYAFLPEGLVFPLIHNALRAVTHDPTVHFHHLRHSFASWLTYALMRPPESPDLLLAPAPQWLAKWDAAEKWMALSAKLHRDLYGNSFPTRRNLYAVSRLLGHSGPVMSLEHYVHTADLLLALWLEKKMPLFERKVWIAASGTPMATAYRFLEANQEGKASGWALVERNWNKIVQEENGAGKRLPAGDDAPGTPASDASAERDSSAQDETLLAVDNLWLLLYLSAKEETSKEDLGRRFGLSKSLVVNLIDVANKVERRRSGRRTLMHHFKSKPRKLVDDDHKMRRRLRLAYPNKPREGEDIRALTRFVPRLWKMLRSQPESCRTVLRHYIECPRNERNGLEFLPRESELAKHYLEFLLEIGVKRDEILLVQYADKEDLVAWQVWHKALDLKGDEAVRPATPPAVKKAAHNVIGIRVVLWPANLEMDPTPRAPYGLSYLLVMAGIWSEACSRIGLEVVEEPVSQNC